MKSFLVIGMGNFGRHLAISLQEQKNNVMIVDCDEEVIAEMSGNFTDAVCGDCRKRAVIESLGVDTFDMCVVATGDSLESSLVITDLLKECGAKYIVAKAHSDIQAKFLKQVGADEVVDPEHDIAYEMAVQYTSDEILDYIDIGNEYALFETPINDTWIGKSIIELDIRNTYKINIIAVKNNNVTNIPTPGYVFSRGDHIVLIGKEDEVGNTIKNVERIKRRKRRDK